MRIIYCLLFLLSISVVPFAQSNQRLEIQGYLIDDEFPIIGSDGRLSKLLKDSTYFYKFKDVIFFQIPYYSSHNSSSIVPNKEFQYLIFKEKDNVALWYTDRKIQKLVNLDSFLLKQDFYLNSIHFYSIFTDSSLIVEKISSRLTQDSLFEEYCLKSKLDTSKKAYYKLAYTSGLKYSVVSLSPELDSITKMKLCTIKVINYPFYYKERNILIEEFRYGTYLSEIAVVNVSKLEFLYSEFINKENYK